MAVTTKAEAEALTVEELKAELKARGLSHEGSHLKAGLLEVLLEHMDKAANGEPHTTADDKEETPAVTKSSDTASAVTRSAAETTEASPEADVEAAAEALEKDEETPVAVATTPAVTRAADTESATTRSAEEVADGTEEPSAKKTKTTPEAAPEEPKKMATEESAPASEPTAAA